jgi:hypothetical protein
MLKYKNNGREEMEDNMKRLAIGLMLTLCFLFAVCPIGKAVAADMRTTLFQIGQQSYSNGGVPTEMDAAAYVDQGRVFVPLRYLVHGMGLTDQDIIWDPASSTITIAGINDSNQLIHINLKVGSNQMEALNFSTGKDNVVTMDVAPEVHDGRTYLPARWVVEALGGDLAWNGQTDTLTIDSTVDSPSAGTGSASNQGSNQGPPVEPPISENNNGGPVNATIAGHWGGDYKADSGKSNNWTADFTEDSQGNISGTFTSDIGSGAVAGNRTGLNTLSWNVVCNAGLSFDGTITGNTMSGDFCGTSDSPDTSGTFWGGRVVN